MTLIKRHSIIVFYKSYEVTEIAKPTWKKVYLVNWSKNLLHSQYLIWDHFFEAQYISEIRDLAYVVGPAVGQYKYGFELCYDFHLKENDSMDEVMYLSLVYRSLFDNNSNDLQFCVAMIKRIF